MRAVLLISVTIYSLNAFTLSAPHLDIPKEGLAAEGNHEWQQAISIYLSQLLLTPNRVDLWLRVASIEHQLKQYHLAINAYHHAVTLRPNDSTLYKTLSEIYAESNQPKDALEMINKAVESEPDNIDYLIARTKIANWNKALPVALESEKRLLILSSSSQGKIAPIDILTRIGSLENQMQHYPEALAAYQQALNINPHDARAIQGIALGKHLILPAKKNDTHPILLKPSHDEIMLNQAHAFAWHGKTDAAIEAYQRCLRLYPKMAEAWIEYAEVLTWIGRYIDAFDALNRYQLLMGKNVPYYEKQSRILAMVGRYKSALAMNNPLVQKTPNNPYMLSTNVLALTQAFQINNALFYLKKAEKFGPTDQQVMGIKDITLTPLRSNINLQADYTAASDTTRITDLPVSMQYFLSPTTSFIFQGLYETASAARSSQLGPVDERSNSISDESAKIGFSTQINSLNIKGLVGALRIQTKDNHGIYNAALNTNLGETAQISIESLHDLYRPYLIPQTPKLISLQIMESRLGTYFQWQPFVQKYLNVVASYSDLTNNNSYTHLNIWPKARVYGSEHWLMTLGINGDIWKYKRRATDGYYSPLLFNGYEGTIELYYGQSKNIGYSFSGGFGMQKDEMFPHYYYEEDLAMRMFMGIFTDWELQAKAAYTLRDNPSGNYHCWSSGLVLTRRFA